MKVVTPAQMNEIDSKAINEYGIPGIVLMENAAIKVVEEIKKHLKTLQGKEIFVFAGKGNNGGDAFTVARHVFNNGARVRVYIAADIRGITGDAGINLNIIKKMGVEILQLAEKEQLAALRDSLKTSDIIVDGILGTGFKGSLTGIVKDLVEVLNISPAPIISIDIPTGVNGETGSVQGSCIKAERTVTFGLPKLGLIIHPGCEYTGEVIVADIGIPSEVFNSMDININLISGSLVSKLIPDRYSNSNKGDYGRVFIVTGSVGMTGAGILAASSALRSGAGLVYTGVPAMLTSIYDTALIETVTIPLKDNGTGILARAGIADILDRIDKSTAAAIGPGLSVNDDVTDIIYDIIENASKPLILDADALNVLSRDVSILKKLKVKAVITPHPGEMARLSGISIDQVQNNRIKVAAEFAQKWNVTTVLKGSRTIVALPDGTVYINTNGNSGLSTAGTGDVLTGLITGLVGQGAELSGAAIAGVYLHGLAGDNAAKIKGEHGMIAGDLLEELPKVIKCLKGGSIHESKGNNVYKCFYG
jgi:ADP-dependent NAD(P)H-hydrate dehydratase / NAD(P)H-hydrate epimerase